MTIPFSTYDFFGNLASGVLLLLAFDLGRADIDLISANLNLQASVLLLLAAYVIGQVIAGLSGWLIESNLTNRVLRRPTANLFSMPGAPRLGRRLFPGYFTPLSPETAKRVLAKSSSSGISSPGEPLFHHVRTAAKDHDVTWAKMEAFLARYGFSRNMALALLLSAAIVAAYGQADLPIAVSQIALLFVLLAVAMYYRYLKFYRQYAYEMYTAYPDLPETP